MQAESVRIAIAQSSPIDASLWHAADPKAVVMLHPGTAISQRYYEPFARYLVELGLSVITYDYRGTGRSRPASLRRFEVSMSDWMDDDVAAVTRWTAERFGQLPMLAVGHSLGGHALALSNDTNSLHAAVLIASHAGATATIHSPAERARVWLLMRVLAPLLCSVLGYMPGRRLGLGEDLPRGVMLQWSRWTALPGYFFDDPSMQAAQRMSRVRIALLVVGFEDDAWANAGAVDRLVAPLVNAKMERRHITPIQAGLSMIGHMGFFRKSGREHLWPQVGSWLIEQLATTKATDALEAQ